MRNFRGVGGGPAAAYRDEIERAIKRAVAADAAAHDEVVALPAGTPTIDVEVERRGKAFRDMVWIPGAITEEYARRTAADPKLPLDMEAAAPRSARRRQRASAVSTDVGPRRSSARGGWPSGRPRSSAAAEAAAAAAAARRARAAAAASAAAQAENGERLSGWIGGTSSAAGCRGNGGAHSARFSERPRPPRQEPLADLRRPEGQKARWSPSARIVGAEGALPGAGEGGAARQRRRRREAEKGGEAGGAAQERRRLGAQAEKGRLTYCVRGLFLTPRHSRTATIHQSTESRSAPRAFTWRRAAGGWPPRGRGFRGLTWRPCEVCERTNARCAFSSGGGWRPTTAPPRGPQVVVEEDACTSDVCVVADRPISSDTPFEDSSVSFTRNSWDVSVKTSEAVTRSTSSSHHRPLLEFWSPKVSRISVSGGLRETRLLPSTFSYLRRACRGRQRSAQNCAAE